MSEETINQEPQNDVDAAEAEYNAAFAAALKDDQPPAAPEKAEASPEVDDVPAKTEEVEAAPAATEPQGAEPETVEQLKARLAVLAAERDKILHQARSDAGRVAALQRQLAQPKQEAVPKHDATAALAAVDQLNDFAPDAAKAIRQTLQHFDEQLSQVTATNQQSQQEREVAQFDATKQAWQRDLSAVHPDWEQVDNSPEFGAYMQTHPEKLFYAQANPFDAAAQGRFITEFKAAQAAKQEAAAATRAALAASKKTQLTNAVGISRGTSGQKSDPDDYDTAYQKELKRI
ncbi:hypothetical protein [Janthinobacterium sp. B9-8]|uniref:hypothetical protein n=1 Tax=Janthinobacterium sp. B9-8 TaxID=1236179 RepID=UPI00061D072B|nr:hypothetical protein [Janthinobacterium sp. B9-8]AMC34737.1 hypothetical protein VN23_09005 [Janthinobacterium sp. B9-8]